MLKKGWAIGACIAFAAMIVLGTIQVWQVKPSRSQNNNQSPQPVGLINDFGHLLTDEQNRVLTAKAAEFEKRTTVQLAVLTVETISPYSTIEPYATELFNQWGIGQQGKNNGLLLLVAIKERQVRIEVGRGLESTLTDAKCKEILQTQVSPFLRAGDYFRALQNGMDAMINIIEQH